MLGVTRVCMRIAQMAAFRQRKLKQLAAAGRGEWDINYDRASDKVVYKNLVSGDVQWRMPEALRSFGNLHDLVNLNVEHNCLFELPETLCDLPFLRTVNASYNNVNTIHASMKVGVEGS